MAAILRKAAHLRQSRALIFFIATFWLAAWMTAQAQDPAGAQFEWRFSLRQNRIVSSSITTENVCHARHRFQVDSNNLPSFMRLLDNSSFYVNSQSKHILAVEFNSSGLKVGQYESLVSIRCLTCKHERGCSLDRQLLHLYMTVEAETNTANITHAEPGPSPAGPSLPYPTPVPDQNFVRDRILVVIPFDSAEGVRTTAKRLATAHDLAVVEIYRLKSLDAALIVYALRDGTDALAKAEELRPVSPVLIAQPDYLYHTSDHIAQETDAYSQLQYGPRLIRADRVRKLVSGRGVKVAVIDTGVDSGHPALKGKIAEQADMTGRGFTPDIHGTLLAGIIVSEPKNGVGISGIAPQSDLLAVKACQPQTPQAIQAQCWSLTLARGLDLALQKKVQVINLSLGGPREKLVTRLIDEGAGRGIVVVAAAGNNGPQGQPDFPAALPNVVSVTAVDAKEQLYAYATQGEFIDLAAPGVEIVSTSPGGKLLVSSGTSLASAFVTGVVSLVLQQDSRLSPQSLQTLLERTAKDLGPTGKDPQFGSGLVDACKAVTQLKGDKNLCR
jgi:hypothetical protein